MRRFVEQVYIPQKYENGDWRRATGQEAEGLFRRSILPDIGEFRCRDLRAENLRGVLRELAARAASYGSVCQVKCAMGDMVRMMVAEGYLSTNIAEGLEDAEDGKTVGSFPTASCHVGRVFAGMDCSRRTGASGV